MPAKSELLSLRKHDPLRTAPGHRRDEQRDFAVIMSLGHSRRSLELRKIGESHFWLRGRLARVIGRLDFVRLRIRTRLVRALKRRDPGSGSPIAEAFHGSAYSGDIADYQDYCVHFLGGYELPELRLMSEMCSAIGKCVAYEIGASTGHHALLLASVCAEVHCFEPFERQRQVAERRMAENGLEHVVIHPFGLGARDELLPYFWDESNTNGMAGSFSSAHTNMAVHSELEVRRGDGWRTAGGAPPPDFIKLDVEGFEATALAGLRETLRTSEPAILVEISWDGFDNMEKEGGLRQLIPYPF